MPRKKKEDDFEGEDGEIIVTSPDGSETFTLFYGSHTMFSNFRYSPFTVDGHNFTCTEQYFHYKKAVHFEDEEIAEQILKTETPREQKALGRRVKNYDQAVWEEVGVRYMKEGLLAKFDQNEDLREKLLKSTGTTLVEASPRDRKWGIGLSIHNPKAADRNAWRGRNLLGEVLMEVREELSKKYH